ncbi:MAG TPA: RsmG family class I SAM-dependent methyltransferase [Acidimicrobiales bacterium]
MLERSDLFAVLEESAALGYLGPGPVTAAHAHAAGFAGCFDRTVARVLDLGSGGGLPGLVLASMLPDARVTLLDASLSRTDFLRRAVGRLGWADRVRVVTGRAEVLGRSADWRATQDVVVSRSFGPPAVTAECASPFLRSDGLLVVSEPPEPDAERWPAEALSLLGLVRLEPAPESYAVFAQRTTCPGRFPRRSLQRPLF